MRLLLVFVLYAVALSIALARRGVRGRVTTGGRISKVRPTRLLVVGATGGTGRQLVTQALERGYTVTALVRDPTRLPVEHERLRIVRGDVLDYASVEAAVREQDAVVSALGHKRFFSTAGMLSEGTRNIVRAMEAHNVARLVCETSLGLGDSAGRMGLYYTLFTIPVILPLYFWDKTTQERAIATSRLEWVIVRPGALKDGEKRGGYRHGPVGGFIGTVGISRADVADFMLNQLTADTYVGSAPGVCW